MQDIIISKDNYTGAMKSRYKEAAETIDQVVQEYSQILTSLADDGVKGETAESLKQFAQLVNDSLDGRNALVMGEFMNLQSNFISDIEEKDNV